MRIFRRRQRNNGEITQDADVVIVRKNRQDRVAARRENAAQRREQRAEIVKHRKWIFISIAVIVVTALAFFCIIKFGGFL